MATNYDEYTPSQIAAVLRFAAAALDGPNGEHRKLMRAAADNCDALQEYYDEEEEDGEEVEEDGDLHDYSDCAEYDVCGGSDRCSICDNYCSCR